MRFEECVFSMIIDEARLFSQSTDDILEMQWFFVFCSFFFRQIELHRLAGLSGLSDTLHLFRLTLSI